MKVCLAIPNGGSVKAKTMTGVFAAMANMMAQGIGIVLAECESTFSFHNRWHAVKQAIETKCDYVWFIDADQTIPADAFFKLWGHDKCITAAPYNYRRLPLVSTAKMRNVEGKLICVSPETLPTELFKCPAIGMGCMLIKLSVFKAIPQPWFACEWDQTTGELILTEDHWFCRQASEVGIPTWVDPTIEVKHVGDFLY
jgi:hypothetical protein